MKLHVGKICFLLAAMLVPCLGDTQAAKTPGVTDSQILIGSCSALDGPARYLGLQTIVGATTYVNHINAEGGVHGRKIQLLGL